MAAHTQNLKGLEQKLKKKIERKKGRKYAVWF